MLVSQRHYAVIENGKLKLFLFHIREEQVDFIFNFCASYLSNVIKCYLEKGFYLFPTIIRIQCRIIYQ